MRRDWNKKQDEIHRQPHYASEKGENINKIFWWNAEQKGLEMQTKSIVAEYEKFIAYQVTNFYTRT